jgi:TseV toxin immunity protein TsiV
MRKQYPRIRIRAESGLLLVREGLNLCFYVHRPHSQIHMGVLRCLEIYRKAVGPQALTHHAPVEYWEPLNDAAWEQTRRELLAPRIALLRLGDSAQSGNQYRFYYYGKPVGDPSVRMFPGTVCALEYWLPTEFLEQHGPERVRSLALEMAESLPFCSGHVSLAFNGELDIAGVPEAIRRDRFRHPGLDIVDIGHMAGHLGTRVRGAYWMTFLGQPVLGALGGAAALRARLTSPGTTVQELDSERAVVTLGQWPEAGDTEAGQLLPAYRELARVLEPWTYFTEPLHEYSNIEEQRRWERRFLD